MVCAVVWHVNPDVTLRLVVLLLTVAVLLLAARVYRIEQNQ